jgi:hypothetical protein
MNTIKNMLEFQMLILENVYEDETLFRNELKKSKKWLDAKELITLKKWLLKRFSNSQVETIREELNNIV